MERAFRTPLGRGSHPASLARIERVLEVSLFPQTRLFTLEMRLWSGSSLDAIKETPIFETSAFVNLIGS